MVRWLKYLKSGLELMLANNTWHVLISSLPLVGKGALVTIYLALGSMLGALLLGLAISLCKLSSKQWLIKLLSIYVSFFRGTPLLIQLLIIYFGLTSFHITLDPLTAAYCGLILHFSAYISETLRAAISSVDKGQWESAYALGMRKTQVLRYIILPQAARVAVPPLWNSFIDVLKSTSLASVVTVPELTRNIEEISAAQFVFMPLFLELAFLYWIMVLLMTRVQDWLEKKWAVY